MAFLVFQRPKMIEKRCRPNFRRRIQIRREIWSIFKKISNFCFLRFLGESIKLVKLNFAIKMNQGALDFDIKWIALKYKTINKKMKKKMRIFSSFFMGFRTVMNFGNFEDFNSECFMKVAKKFLSPNGCTAFDLCAIRRKLDKLIG